MNEFDYYHATSAVCLGSEQMKANKCIKKTKQNKNKGKLNPNKAVQPQQMASFSQHGRLFRPPSMRPDYTHSSYLPTDHYIQNTHTHTKNARVYQQQWSWLCGCKAPPQWEEAEETSTAVCVCC